MASSRDISTKKTSENAPGTSDGFKWALLWLLILAGCVGNWYFKSVSAPVLVAAGIVLFVVVLLAFSWTRKGQVALGFVKGAKQELRRVHWQTRPEVMQVVIRVVLVVAVTSVVLWLFDSLFMRAIGLISR